MILRACCWSVLKIIAQGCLAARRRTDIRFHSRMHSIGQVLETDPIRFRASGVNRPYRRAYHYRFWSEAMMLEDPSEDFRRRSGGQAVLPFVPRPWLG